MKKAFGGRKKRGYVHTAEMSRESAYLRKNGRQWCDPCLMGKKKQSLVIKRVEKSTYIQETLSLKPFTVPTSMIMSMNDRFIHNLLL